MPHERLVDDTNTSDEEFEADLIEAMEIAPSTPPSRGAVAPSDRIPPAAPVAPRQLPRTGWRDAARLSPYTPSLWVYREVPLRAVPRESPPPVDEKKCTAMEAINALDEVKELMASGPYMFVCNLLRDQFRREKAAAHADAASALLGDRREWHVQRYDQAEALLGRQEVDIVVDGAHNEQPLYRSLSASAPAPAPEPMRVREARLWTASVDVQRSEERLARVRALESERQAAHEQRMRENEARRVRSEEEREVRRVRHEALMAEQAEAKAVRRAANIAANAPKKAKTSRN